ncbi:hypothetical protein QT971_06290 [Microcoleus sp. herbarium19]|uniref:hypothetical protein n=1 Tax=Microcoleus sp. herbarium19 TaxID=3055440 RepID=UPI002FD0F112
MKQRIDIYGKTLNPNQLNTSVLYKPKVQKSGYQVGRKELKPKPGMLGSIIQTTIATNRDEKDEDFWNMYDYLAWIASSGVSILNPVAGAGVGIGLEIFGQAVAGRVTEEREAIKQFEAWQKQTGNTQSYKKYYEQIMKETRFGKKPQMMERPPLRAFGEEDQLAQPVTVEVDCKESECSCEKGNSK